MELRKYRALMSDELPPVDMEGHQAYQEHKETLGAGFAKARAAARRGDNWTSHRQVCPHTGHYKHGDR